MFSKLKFINFVVVLFIIGTSSSNPVDLTCEYSETAPGLAYIVGSHYKCNLETEIFALDSVVGEVFGEHIGGKSETDVDVLFITGQDFFKIPNMKAIFSNLVYLHIDNTPIKYLKAEHLSPYGVSLVVLIIKGSAIEIIEKDSFDELTGLTALDLNGNKIFYIHPDAFASLASLALTNLLLNGNECKNGDLDVIAWDNGMSMNFATFLESVKQSACGTIGSEGFATKYLSNCMVLDLENASLVNILEIQGGEITDLEEKLSNITIFYDEAVQNISKLETQNTDLNISYEECISDLDNLNITFLSCNETNWNLTDINDNLTELYDEANSTISSLELTILNLNSSNIQLKKDFNTLNQSFADLKIEADDLKSKIDEIDVTAEKCREVNGTCRFTNGTNGYTCIAHDVNITAPGTETTTIEWTGTHLTNSNNRNVLALLLRELDVHFMPTTIGTTFVDIKVLTVQKCGLKKLSKGDFNDLAVLKTLEITSNNIESIDSGVFDSLTSLESLDLSENKIKLLPSKVFVLLPQLKNLNLDKNELTSLKADFLASTTKIEYFSAINNQLAKVESSFVWKMRNAKKIDLTGNGCGLVFDITLGSYITFYSAILSKC